jgi:hypothetical protein
MGKESSLEKRLRDGVKRLGGWAIKFLPFVIAGLPDRIVLMPFGRIWFVEMKAPGKKPTPLQQVWLNRLTKLGFKTRVIDNEILLKEFFKEISDDL